MKLFDRFNKKDASTIEKASPAVPNFIDDLVDYCSSKPEVNAAYFGFAYDGPDRTQRLFVALDHSGDNSSVKNGVLKIKSAYMNDTDIHYVSSSTEPEQFAYVRQHNAPFFHKDQPFQLQQKVMKRWFDVASYQEELIATLQRSEVYTMVGASERVNKHIVILTIPGRYEKFIPLFSHQDMIAKSQMTKISEHEAHVKLPFEEISGMAGKNALYLLNPFTPFEVELHV